MRLLTILGVLVAAAAPSAAQIQSRPTDPPLVTAVNESWYLRGEPLQVAGDVYYPSGATLFFNGNHMVRTGHYNGVPIYADTTVEPFSVVLVPISRGLMQPYERRRAGDLAGTTGSRAPSFPVQTAAAARTAPSPPAAAVPPTGAPVPTGAISVFTPGSATVSADAPRPVGTTGAAASPEPRPVGTAGILTQAPRTTAPPVVTLARPLSNDGVWIQFLGERWVSAGASVPFESTRYTRVGEHGTFPVFARTGLDEDMIYLPTARAGFVAPYRLKD